MEYSQLWFSGSVESPDNFFFSFTLVTESCFLFVASQLQDLENGGVNDIGPRDVAGLLTALQDVDLSEVLELPRALPCDEQALPCDHTAPFRSITGWCNNLRSPGRGKSLRAFSRLLPPLVCQITDFWGGGTRARKWTIAKNW